MRRLRPASTPLALLTPSCYGRRGRFQRRRGVARVGRAGLRGALLATVQGASLRVALRLSVNGGRLPPPMSQAKRTLNLPSFPAVSFLCLCRPDHRLRRRKAKKRRSNEMQQGSGGVARVESNQTVRASERAEPSWFGCSISRVPVTRGHRNLADSGMQGIFDLLV